MKPRSPYQILPDLLPVEYEALRASIAERGVDIPKVVDQEGNTLDGLLPGLLAFDDGTSQVLGTHAFSYSALDRRWPNFGAPTGSVLLLFLSQAVRSAKTCGTHNGSRGTSAPVRRQKQATTLAQHQARLLACSEVRRSYGELQDFRNPCTQRRGYGTDHEPANTPLAILGSSKIADIAVSCPQADAPDSVVLRRLGARPLLGRPATRQEFQIRPPIFYMLSDQPFTNYHKYLLRILSRRTGIYP